MRVLKWVLAAVAALCVFIILVVSAVQWGAFDPDFYWDMYYQQHTPERVGMSQDDLTRVTGEMLDYLNNEPGASFADIKAVIGGTERNVFNDREVTHMEDVKRLYAAVRFARGIAIVTAAACIILLMIWAGPKSFRQLCAAYLIVGGALFLLAGGIWLITRNNFTEFWDRFHMLFFTNDLWILNPQTDLLIRMVPEAFFSALVRRIGFMFAGMAGFAAYTCIWGLLCRRKAAERE